MISLYIDTLKQKHINLSLNLIDLWISLLLLPVIKVHSWGGVPLKLIIIIRSKVWNNRLDEV